MHINLGYVYAEGGGQGLFPGAMPKAAGMLVWEGAAGVGQAGWREGGELRKAGHGQPTSAAIGSCYVREREEREEGAGCGWEGDRERDRGAEREMIGAKRDDRSEGTG